MMGRNCFFIRIILLWSMLLALGAGQAAGADFLRASGNRFVLAGRDYKAIGMCNYPFVYGNYDYISRTVRRAKAGGVTLIRAASLFNQYELAWNDEGVWRKLDWLLKVCGDEKMLVLIDLSGFHGFLTEVQQIDSWAPAGYAQWDAMVDFATARVNAFTGVAYKDDPVIGQWLIAGESVPYGFTGDIHNMSRNVNVIEQFLFHVAARLKQKDPNHLVSGGGLLHLSGVPRDSAGREYWKTIWSHPNIDCGAVHLYADDYTTLPVGEWRNLATYKSYCDGIGKPFVLEEWGIDRFVNSASVVENYFRFAYQASYDLNIPLVITWNWGPSGGFSLFPHRTDALLGIVSEWAVRWGYAGPIYEYADPLFVGNRIMDFESGTQGFSSTNYGGNNGAPAVSAVRATSGKNSLRVPLRFTTTDWNFAGISRTFSPLLNWSGERKIACDLWVPAEAQELEIKFIITNNAGSWVGYAQTGGMSNNWVDPGRWNTVYADLTPASIDWDKSSFSFDNVVALTLEIHHHYGSPPFSGDVFIDNFRLGDLLPAEPRSAAGREWLLND